MADNINWGGIDTQYGERLGNIFNPNVIAERQNKLADLAQGRQLEQMKLMQAQDAMQQAPILRQRENDAYAAKLASATRQEEGMKILQDPNTTPEQKKSAFVQMYPEKAAEQEFKPSAARDFNQPFLPSGQPNLAYQKYEIDKARAGKSASGDNVSWQSVQTDTGLVQINPKTGEVRPLGISKPLPPTKQPKARK